MFDRDTFNTELNKFFRREEQSMSLQQQEEWIEFKSVTLKLVLTITPRQYYLLWKIYRLSKGVDND